VPSGQALFSPDMVVDASTAMLHPATTAMLAV